MSLIIRNNATIIDNAAVDVDFNNGFSIGLIAPGVIVLAVATLGITTAMIANNAVTGTELAANSVNSSKIVNSSINTNKLAANSITTDKVIDLTIDDTKIAPAAITPVKMAVVPALATDQLNPIITTRTNSLGLLAGNFGSVNAMCIGGETLVGCGCDYNLSPAGTTSEILWCYPSAGTTCTNGAFCTAGASICTITAFARCMQTAMS